MPSITNELLNKHYYIERIVEHSEQLKSSVSLLLCP